MLLEYNVIKDDKEELKYTQVELSIKVPNAIKLCHTNWSRLVIEIRGTPRQIIFMVEFLPTHMNNPIFITHRRHICMYTNIVIQKFTNLKDFDTIFISYILELSFNFNTLFTLSSLTK